MKKSRTQKAVDAIMRSRARREKAIETNRYPKFDNVVPLALSVTKAAKRFNLNVSGLLRAVKRREKEKRCPECKQVIR